MTSRPLISTALLVGIGIGALPGRTAPSPGLTVRNLAEGAVLRHSVALLRGQFDAPDGAVITIENRSTTCPSRKTRATVVDKRFLALAQLAPGENRLCLTAPRAKLSLSVRYTPQTNPHVVRIIYYTDKTGDTTYQSERPKDPQNYAARLRASAKLLQAFTAESLHDQGFGRKTFNLETDAAGEVLVHTVRGPQAVEYYHAKDGGALWSEIYTDLDRRMPNPRAKNAVIMAFTRFDPVTQLPKAHTALGGGNLGLFGSAGMFVWPSDVADIQSALSDITRVDRTRTFDDSNGRSNYWGLASTTLGAVLHEMGHTFGLPHSSDGFDIMTRGFDHLNRMFTVIEPPHAQRPTPYRFPDAEVAQFRPISAQRLAYSPWMHLDERWMRPNPQVAADVDLRSGMVVTRARYGLRVVGINGGGDARENDHFPGEAPTEKTYALDDLRRRAGGRELSLDLTDTDGNQLHVPAERFRPPPGK